MLTPWLALPGAAERVAGLSAATGLDLVVRPLLAAGGALADTLDAYLEAGGAVESCARTLFVHPNTVRYRLRRVAEVTGLEPTAARDAHVLRTACAVGRLAVARGTI